MSDLHADPAWNEAAKSVARELDRHDIREAEHLLRSDLYQLQNDPHAQREFLRMVDDHDHKGMGADLVISRLPNGQETWQISEPRYGSVMPYRGAPIPVQPDVVIVQPERPSVGERVLDGVATGAGVGLGLGIMGKIFHHR
ncbi:MAG: hypothetical protein K2X81_09325 [Candidatus Obscuribacterales bacterium]|nr:hypothetical protein [Candidatus Obscuribacterales bacterium]